jgi:hypothetical protein
MRAIGFKTIFAGVSLWASATTYADTHTLYLQSGTAYQHDEDFDLGRTLGPFSESMQKLSSWAALKSQLDLLTNSSLKPDDQVVIMIDAHGISSNGKEKSHTVRLDDGFVSLDELTPYLQKLAEAGVKVALLDLSCHSAPSLSLVNHSPELKKHLCVVTGDGIGSTAYGSFLDSLDASMREGQSIENWFGEARLKDFRASPSISTAAGRACNKSLAEIHQVRAATLFWSYEKLTGLQRTQPCAPPQAHPVISNLISDLGPIIENLTDQDPDVQLIFQELKTSGEMIKALSEKHPELIRQMKATRRLPDGRELTWIEAQDIVDQPQGWPSLWAQTYNDRIFLHKDLPYEVLAPLLNLKNDYTPERLQTLAKRAPEIADLLQEEESNFQLYTALYKFLKEGRPKAFELLTEKEKNTIDIAGYGSQLRMGYPERNLYRRCYEGYLKKHPQAKENACQKIQFKSR